MVTGSNVIREAIRCGWLASAVPFGSTLKGPASVWKEALVLTESGRMILFEPYMSWTSYPVYGLLHHEPVAWGDPISAAEELPRPRDYYAAQGNATRTFFLEKPGWLQDWHVFHAEAFSAFSYLLCGGYGKPGFYPATALQFLQKIDARLSWWPRLFGARCLIGLNRAKAL